MLCRTCISIMSRSRSDLEVNIQMLIFCVCYISPKPLIGFSWILCQMFTLSRQCTSTFQWFLHMSWIAGRFFMKLVVSISLFNTVCRTVMSDQGHSQSSNGKFLYPLHIFETTGRFFLQLGCSAKQDDIQNPTYQWCQIKIKVFTWRLGNFYCPFIIFMILTKSCSFIISFPNKGTPREYLLLCSIELLLSYFNQVFINP